ncbi:response regulator transcription factor [Amycolatopsis sp. YIM 10]|uniref:LuxR C-terminal-related transcriptional regulator n=1 Tax=Amycolatopsis sp. YIM 10 TaxID=2653857 RepID=UPI0012904F56|nr:response regulator transcription factor [Amycolatopsis sp. YIM 10]
MNPVRAFLVDDQELLAEALAAKLSAVGGLLVVGRSSTTDPGLVDAVARSRPHVITVDIQPVGPATANLLGRLGAAAPDARIVVLTGSHDPVQAVVAARWGATAWVGKDSSTEHLVAVLHGVCGGKAYFSPDLLGFVLAELRADVQRVRDSNGPLDVLSARERDVLLGIVEGKRGSQIAAELFLSVNTVRTHTHNIFSKLKVHSRLEAASLARAAGMQPRIHSGLRKGPVP